MFNDDLKIPFKGKEYGVKINFNYNNSNELNFKDHVFYFNMQDNFIQDIDSRNKMGIVLLKKWYKSYGEYYLKVRTEEIAKVIGVKFSELRVKNVKTIWGSISSKNNINYNLRLIMLPSELIDYVIVHELCHIIHRNHSKEFWCEVSKYVSNYKIKREELNKLGNFFSI